MFIDYYKEYEPKRQKLKKQILFAVVDKCWKHLCNGSGHFFAAFVAQFFLKHFAANKDSVFLLYTHDVAKDSGQVLRESRIFVSETFVTTC